MILVVDASVAVKWFVREDGQEAARALLGSNEPLVAPDLLVAEVGNILWKKVRLQEIPPAQAQAAMVVLPHCFERLVPAANLHERALSLALTLDHPLYDCLYLACAEAQNAPFVTADNRLIEITRKSTLSIRCISLDDPSLFQKAPTSLNDLETPTTIIDEILRLTSRREDIRTDLRPQNLGSNEARMYFSDNTPIAHLRRIVADLDPSKRAEILTIAWLGEFHEISQFNWSEELKKAHKTTEETFDDITYIISKLTWFRVGILVIQSGYFSDTDKT